MNTPISYQSIQSLIVSANFISARVECVFQVPGTQRQVSAVGRLRKSNETKRAIQGFATEGIRNQVQWGLRDFVGGFFSSPHLKHAAMRTTDRLVSDQAQKVEYTREEREAAVVEAFMSVATQFNFNNQTQSWQTQQAMSEFQKRLQQNPLTEGYDKEVLARMLIEIAQAEGSIGMEEQELLDRFIDRDLIDVDQFLTYPALTAADLMMTTSPAIRENLFMLAATMVMADHNVTDKEKQKLVEFAKLMQLPAPQVTALVKVAKFFVIEIALVYSSDEPEAILAIAAQLKLERSEAEQFIADYRRRKYQ